MFALNSSGFSQDGAHKIVNSLALLKRYIGACRILGAKVVITIGSWDMLHIGHVRYLMRARASGDVLVVGVDTDRAVKLYKGPNRPIIPQSERMEMVSYLACVNFVTPVDDVDPKGQWKFALLDALRPEVFVAVQDSYPQEQRRQIRKRCGKLIVLPRQAEETSSTDTIQRILKGKLLQTIAALEEQR